MKEGNKVMIVGLGSVGYAVLEILSRNPILSEWVKIIGASVTQGKGQRRVNLAVAIAEKLGH
jgi:homoserine dehydrogenase